MQSITQRATAAVGDEKPNDWRLKPADHAASLGPDAAPLKDILLAPKVADIITTYETADRAAGRAQRLYKRLARVAAWSAFGAALIGSLVLMFAYFVQEGSALSKAALAQAVLLLISFGASLLIGSLKPFESWMMKRAEAENARIALFDYVMAGPREAGSGALALLPLQLEYFRRYQLDVQRLYYGGRGNQHAAAARGAWRWRLFAFALVLVGGGFSLLWAVQDAAWLPPVFKDLLASMPMQSELAQRVPLGLGIIAAALQGLLASYAVMALDERNAARYRSTADNLEDLAGTPLEQARAAAAGEATDPAAARSRVLAFVALVQDQISSEHREWIALRKVAPDLALDRLAGLRLPPRT